MKLLSRVEEMYMVAIWELKDDAYGVTIRKQVALKTGKMISYGGLYIALDQLYKKGYVEKTEGEPEARRGGRKKFYYSITELGVAILKSTFEHHNALWEGVTDLITK
ncbi:PadR family transcriptional regulator [bacterium]|nr:PadR family transcriptional regulator [bacterium]